MLIRAKILLLLAGVFLTYIAAAQAIQRLVVLPGFTSMEREEAAKDQDRCTEAIQREIELMSDSLHDWSAWDDTHEFIVDENEAYKTSNLIPEMFSNNKLNLVCFLDLDGRIVWFGARDLTTMDPLEFKAFSHPYVNPHGPLLDIKEPSNSVDGIMLTEHGPMLVVSRRILHTNNDGPVRGTMIRGRLLGQEQIKQIAERAHVDMNLMAIPGRTPPEAAFALKQLSSGTPLVVREAEDGKALQVHSVLQGVDGKPALLMTSRIPRDITARGRTAINVALASDFAAALVISLLLWGALRRIVIGPLTRLTNHATMVGRSGDLSKPIALRRRDEVGTLANEFDQMMTSLADSRAQLLDVAHHAGRAEVATNVLHNVGNVLNGVNVSAHVVSEKVRNSEANTLTQAAKVLNEHQNDLGEFLTKNDQGRQFPGFLTELAAQVTREQETVLREMNSLTAAIEHIRNVIDSQQQHSRHGALLEPVEPAELVRQTVELSAESLKRHGIDVQQEVEPMEAISLDRHRILQILVNVFTNAVNSVKQGSRDGRRIMLKVSRLRETERGGVCFRVEDNGVGIAPENLDRIFALGFTTRNDGHGIGLHGAANMAREMGGSLTAHSGGLGCGAVFTLTVPLTPVEARS